MRNEVKLANPNYDSSKIEEFKNVWVFCEQRQGQMMSTSYELISEGRKLADELGVKLCGLLVGDNVDGLAESIGGYGADEVIVCDHPLLKNYTTDAYSAGLTVVDSATAEMCGQVIYPAAVLKGEKEEAAQAFLDYLQTSDAMAVFESVGFSPAN